MNKIVNMISKFACFGLMAILVMGCKGGGGSGGGSLAYSGTGGGVFINQPAPGYDPIPGGDDPIPGRTNNPEPSSLLLLGSGLVSMAIYTKAKLKSKGKK